MKSSSLFSLRFLRNVLIIIFGNFIYAVGVVFFILPSGLITGGTTGIGLIMNHFTGMDISIFVGIFNVPCSCWALSSWERNSPSPHW